ncbi:hypothetical protein UlMin_025970 [Ulmus minor]
MHGFSTFDGFVEITECTGEMIKYVANEPSVGLFYVQQHTQNAVPNVIRLRNNIVGKSHETILHTEDTEDSITMVSSMKECGFPIADEMIRDIKKSLSIMSTKQPRRGLFHDSSSSFQTERTSSWTPARWGRSPVFARQDSERSGYFSTVFKSAKEKASNLKWPTKDEKLLFYPNPPLPVAPGVSSQPNAEPEELPLSSQVADDSQEELVDGGLTPQNLISLSENYDEFKADKEAKLQEWLERLGNPDNHKGASGSEAT